MEERAAPRLLGARDDRWQPAHELEPVTIDGAQHCAERDRTRAHSQGQVSVRHQERHLANASFALGMVASIADKLLAMKAGRDEVINGTGRGLVVLKASVVDTELGKLDLKLRTVSRASRMVSPMAYEAGGEAGESLAINPGIRRG